MINVDTGRLRPGSGIRCKFHQLTAKFLIITGLLTIFHNNFLLQAGYIIMHHITFSVNCK